MERTLSIVKPDGVKKNLIGEVIKRFEQQGLKIAALRMLTTDYGSTVLIVTHDEQRARAFGFSIHKLEIQDGGCVRVLMPSAN